MSAPVKRKKFSPKQQLDYRMSGMQRVEAILKLKKPKQVDIWWAMRFIRQVRLNPEMKFGWGKTESHLMWATTAMMEFHERWPDWKWDGKEITAKRLRSDKRQREARAELRKTSIALKAAEKQMMYWGTRFHNLSIRDPKFKDMQHKVTEIRQLIVRLTNHQKLLRAKLGK